MRMAILTAACLAGLALPTAAQETPADSSHAAAAAELVEVLRLGDERIAEMSGLTSGMMGTNPMAAQLAEVALEFYREFAPWEKLRPVYIRIYQDAFTETELRALIAFHRSPVGQRLLEKQPVLTKATMEAIQELIMPHLPELQQRMMARMGGGY
jgi:hypothetical protein